MSFDKVKFRKAVRPGDQLRIEVDIIHLRSKAARCQAKITVDGTVVSEGEFMCMVTDRELER
jgi:3-hydroxymyristoyl/3-hydroxydecanoyl-(acyl carrier protein) dehydratase